MAKRLVIGICGGTGQARRPSRSGSFPPSRRKVFWSSSRIIITRIFRISPWKNAPSRILIIRTHSTRRLLIEHVRQLREGHAIDRPVYDFAKYQRASHTVRLNSHPAIILEGILIFENKPLRELMDIKIFVDTDADLRFIRRLGRDIRERGRTVESVVEQYLATVRPMHMEFIEPSKRHADVIIPEGGHNEVGIDLVIQKIRSLVMSDMSRS